MKEGPTPDLSKLRTILFWDTRIELIDWLRYKRAVIERVFERGDEQEKEEVVRFYGQAAVIEVLKNKIKKDRIYSESLKRSPGFDKFWNQNLLTNIH